MNRRNFIKTAAVAAATGTLIGSDLSSGHASEVLSGAVPKGIKNYNPRMQYRLMGKTGEHVSALGFGMLRLPFLPNSKTVDEKRSIEMLRHAIDNGLNYVDAAYVYLNGESERITGLALQDGYRERVNVTSKAPWWIMERPEDFDRYFDESRRRLKTDVIDFYLIHCVTNRAWNEKMLPFKLIEKMQQLKQQKKIRFAGFSFHDNLVMFKKVVDATPDWDFSQIQLNYLDTEFEAGVLGLKYAAGRGLGVTIMEPLRNGYLANLPTEVQDIFVAAGKDRSPIEWALDYLWDMPEAGVVLSGMSSMQHVRENLESASRSAVGMLDWKDRQILAMAAKRLMSYEGVIPCTGCDQCIPCPKGVGIGYVFSYLYNPYHYQSPENKKRLKMRYHNLEEIRGLTPSFCDGCGACIPKCPQGLDIPKRLQAVRAMFA